MNTISNNKLLLLITLGIFIMNGCVAQENFQKSSFVQPKNVIKKSKTWKNITPNRDDCPDCYASDEGAKKRVQLKSFEPIEEHYVDNVIDTKSYGTYDYSVTPDDTYIEQGNIKVTPKQSYVNSSRNSFNTKLTYDTTIQVGAFRHYSGAEKIAKKYSLLSSSQYRVKIETGTKDGLPIHRVRISGFHSKGQAKAFMQRYASNDAFFVRR